MEVADRSRPRRSRAARCSTPGRLVKQWYNGDLDGRAEKPIWVPYHFLLGQRTFDFPPTTHQEADIDLGPVRPETRQAVLTLVADRLKRPLTESEQQPAIRLDDLGLDSLDRMELSLQVERQFGFSGEEACDTIGQLLALAEGRAARRTPKPPPPEWAQTPAQTGPLELRGDTIPAAFVELALTHPKEVIVADDLAGALTGERLLVGAFPGRACLRPSG